jgi:acyl transferase domain-containing protein/acyl-CoA synthetase (AMP-forming)/AMP-acid ligase II/NAD(P)-dependent dehydrogenase (short-subunit alcohol dehydrogenase family)/acyl carrier protein
MNSTLVHVIRSHAETNPAKTALLFLDRNLNERVSLSFGDLDAAARDIAAQLLTHVEIGDPVVLLFASEPEFIKVFFGCLYAGIVAVPTVPPNNRRRNQIERLSSIVRDTQSKLLVTDDSNLSAVRNHLAEERFNPATRCVSFSEISISNNSWKLPDLNANGPAFIQYSSGSTGAPKGILLSHQNILENEAIIQNFFGTNERTVSVSWLPLYHDMGLIGSVIQSIYAGGTAVLMTPMTFLSEPANWLRAISRYGATISGGPNFAYQHCSSVARLAEGELLELGNWQIAFVGAEAVRPGTLQAFVERFSPHGFRVDAFLPCYGLAEATLFVTGARKDAPPLIARFDRAALLESRVKQVSACDDDSTSQCLVGLGNSAASTSVLIVDPVTSTPCNHDKIGEVWISGPSNSEGYWNQDYNDSSIINAKLNNSEKSFLRTGDLGFQHEGQLFITGRIKDLIKIRGNSHSPHDLEQTALSCSDDLQDDSGVAFSIETNSSEGLILLLEVTRRARHGTNWNEVLSSINGAITESHGIHPHEIVLVRPLTLPRTTSGKLQRGRAKELYLNNQLTVVARSTQISSQNSLKNVETRGQKRTPLEETLARAVSEILRIPADKIGIDDNFFDLGADSIALAQLQNRISTSGRVISIVDLFRYHNIASLAKYLVTPEITHIDKIDSQTGPLSPSELSAVAIVGLAGRFPDAPTLQQFWQNLCDGRESVRHFTEEEVLAAGARLDQVRSSNYVRAGVLLDSIDMFDAAYFGMNRREAEMLDPQQRLLLECAVEALESSGYPNQEYCGPVGVFVGRGECGYAERFVQRIGHYDSVAQLIRTLISGSPSYASTLISHHLNLTGPSISVSTACSTSLVAIHEACRSVLSGECDMAIAGGASIDIYQGRGYPYEEGAIASPDGHCRAFSDDAQGTVGGSGAGIVVLKRLDAAIAANDTVHAIIRGSAINNDGGRKVGFAAPSLLGQIEVIKNALRLAQVESRTIQYVEAHGTSTALGDPIEIAALMEAFNNNSSGIASCALGSVKTNIGHLDVAAGVAGLIKVVLALKNRAIPASLNFRTGNPNINFSDGPFYVNTALREWIRNDSPRRAAVSAFGVGGTNAHVIVEEAPDSKVTVEQSAYELLVLSAKTPTALAAMECQLLEHLDKNENLNQADLAHTLQIGRIPLRYRKAIVYAQQNDLRMQMRESQQRKLLPSDAMRGGEIVFMFPGQGSEFANMALSYYKEHSVFRSVVDDCAGKLRPMIPYDIRDLLYLDDSRYQKDADASKTTNTATLQPVLFVVEYALAKLLQSFGIEPNCMIGHSLGEYVAATIAGVFSLDDALRIVVNRGILMQATEPGRMLAISIRENELLQFLEGTSVSIAAVNSRMQCVVSGATAEIDTLHRKLSDIGIPSQLLRSSRGFHSGLMEGILEKFESSFANVDLHAPRIPFVSNLTGTWISDDDAISPKYWSRHIRGCVRFAEGLTTISERSCGILLEVGPGHTLGSLARKHPHIDVQAVLMCCEGIDEQRSLLEAVGRSWCLGKSIQWRRLYGDRRRARIPLPSYPFERQRYWLADNAARSGEARSLQSEAKVSDIADWFYEPSWTQSAIVPISEDSLTKEGTWLLFSDALGVASGLASHLALREYRNIVHVVPGTQFERIEKNVFSIDPNNEDDYGKLLSLLQLRDRARVIHLWSMSDPCDREVTVDAFAKAQVLGFMSLCFLARALTKCSFVARIDVTLVTSGLHDITGNENLVPERATMLAIAKTIPQEDRRFRFNCVDVDLGSLISRDAAAIGNLADTLLDEALAQCEGNVIAVRGRHRWTRTYVKKLIPLNVDAEFRSERRLKKGGVYLITGGLGKIAYEIAKLLANKYSAKLVLVGRSSLPPQEKWNGWITEHASEDPISRKLKMLMELQQGGGAVSWLCVDVSSKTQTEAAFRHATEMFGPIDGVIHAAASMSDAFEMIQELTPESFQSQCNAKVGGMIIVANEVLARRIPLLFVTSSLSTVLGGLGLSSYAAANAFLDSYAERLNANRDLACIAVNWDAWSFPNDDDRSESEKLLLDQIPVMMPDQGVSTFQRIVQSGLRSRIVVSASALHPRIRKWIELSVDEHGASGPLTVKTGGSDRQEILRPALDTPYVSPSNEIEVQLAGIFEEVLGVKAGINDTFFELGGDSLVATQVIARIRELYGTTIPIRDFYVEPTIHAVAQKLGMNKLGVISMPQSDHVVTDQTPTA